MSETYAEFSAVLFPTDHPSVTKRGEEVLVRPFGTRELVLAFQKGDLERWATELLELSRSSRRGRRGAAS